jgi:hypothetical protein
LKLLLFVSWSGFFRNKVIPTIVTPPIGRLI